MDTQPNDNRREIETSAMQRLSNALRAASSYSDHDWQARNRAWSDYFLVILQLNPGSTFVEV